MKTTTSRRKFLQKTAIASTGLTFLSSSLVNAMVSQETFEGYNPYAKETTDIRTLFSDKHLDISGYAYNIKGEKIPNAIIEVWHLSKETNTYRHHAKFKADQNGRYQFYTDIPAKTIGKSARVYFKVTDKNGQNNASELVVSSTGADITSKHWQDNKHLGDLVYPISKSKKNSTKIIFNISNQTI